MTVETFPETMDGKQTLMDRDRLSKVPAAAHSQATRRRCGAVQGFTAVEVIVAVVIVVILAAFASPMFNGTAATSRTSADLVAQDICYVQALSMSRGQDYRIYFYAASYQIKDGNGNPMIIPSSGKSAPVNLASGQTFQSNGFTSYLAFDSMGRPYNGTTALASATSVSITDGSRSTTITVSANTGAVTVQ